MVDRTAMVFITSGSKYILYKIVEPAIVLATLNDNEALPVQDSSVLVTVNVKFDNCPYDACEIHSKRKIIENNFFIDKNWLTNVYIILYIHSHNY